MEGERRVDAQRCSPRSPTRASLAVGISGQMHSSVFLDAHGEVIRPALLWCDGRTTAECARSPSASAARSELRDWRATPRSRDSRCPKVLWLRNHEPEAFARLATVLLAKDFIRYRLTGALATEPSDASAHVDVRHRAAALERRRCSRAVGSAAVARCPTSAARRRCSARVTSEAAAADRAAGRDAGRRRRRGQRVRRGGRRRRHAGRSRRQLGNVGHRARADSRSRASIRGLRAHTFCHVAPDTWYMMGVVLSAGGAFAWYRDQLARELARTGDANERLNAEAASVPRRRRGRDVSSLSPGRAHAASRRVGARRVPRAQPRAHARAPDARRARGHVLRAARLAVDPRRSSGWRRVRCCSPAAARRARSFAGCRPRSSALPVCTVNREEGPAYGAALLAAVGAGAFPDRRVRGARDARRARRSASEQARMRCTMSPMRDSTTRIGAPVIRASEDLSQALLPTASSSLCSLRMTGHRSFAACALSLESCSVAGERDSSSCCVSSRSR